MIGSKIENYHIASRVSKKPGEKGKKIYFKEGVEKPLKLSPKVIFSLVYYPPA